MKAAYPGTPGDHAGRTLKTTAKHLVSLLSAHGTEYLFLSPSTGTAAQEAVYAVYWVRVARSHDSMPAMCTVAQERARSASPPVIAA